MGILDFIIFGLSIIVFAVGAVFMAHQVFCGLDKTALNDKYVWGVNIQGFYFLSAMGIGILATITILAFIFNTSLEPAKFKTAAGIAFGCLISSQILMAADLGRPFRAFRILLGRNFLSPLTLDFLVLTLLSILSFIFMFGIFTGVYWVYTVWKWATLFICAVGMIVHTLLFISRTGAGYQSEPFQSSLVIGSGIWGGSALLTIMMHGTMYGGVILVIFEIATLFVCVCALGSVLADLLASNKPHNLVFFIMTLVVAALLFARSLLFSTTIVPAIIAAILAIIFVYFEKQQTVIHLQLRPVLPEPYSQFERKLVYKPVASEWINLISGIAAVVAVTYVVIIVNTYVIPWFLNLIGYGGGC